MREPAPPQSVASAPNPRALALACQAPGIQPGHATSPAAGVTARSHEAIVASSGVGAITSAITEASTIGIRSDSGAGSGLS